MKVCFSFLIIILLSISSSTVSAKTTHVLNLKVEYRIAPLTENLSVMMVVLVALRKSVLKVSSREAY